MNAKVLKALQKVCSKNKYQERLHNVWVDDGWVCATDSFVAVKVRDDRVSDDASYCVPPHIIASLAAGDEVCFDEDKIRVVADNYTVREEHGTVADHMPDLSRVFTESDSGDAALVNPKLLTTALNVFTAANLRANVTIGDRYIHIEGSDAIKGTAYCSAQAVVCPFHK